MMNKVLLLAELKGANLEHREQVDGNKLGAFQFPHNEEINLNVELKPTSKNLIQSLSKTFIGPCKYSLT